MPPVRVGVWAKVRVNFRVGGQRQVNVLGKLPVRKITPPPNPIRVRVWVRVSFGVGGNFPRTFTCPQVYFMFS